MKPIMLSETDVTLKAMSRTGWDGAMLRVPLVLIMEMLSHLFLTEGKTGIVLDLLLF